MGLKNKTSNSKKAEKSGSNNSLEALCKANFKMEQLLSGNRDGQKIIEVISILEEAQNEVIAKLTYPCPDETLNLVEAVEECDMAKLNLEDAKEFLRGSLRLVK